MKKVTEIRWHGRGGQGVKTACEFIAAVAIHEGKYSQGFPEYGPERSGAPMKGFTRVSTEAIREHYAIYQPDVVMVLDESLIVTEDLCEGLKKGGVLIINTKGGGDPFRGKCPGPLWAVDATGIAIAEIGRPIPNMPMVGALLKVTNVLDLDAVCENVKSEFAKKFDQKTIDGNLRAIRRAYDEVKKNG